MRVPVPESLLNIPFDSPLPSEDTLADVAVSGETLRFGRLYMQTFVSWSRHETAGIVDKFGIPGDLAPSAAKFFATIPDPQDLTAFTPQAALQGTFKAFAHAANALGALDSVPIVGWVIGIGLAAWDMGQAAWTEKHRKEIQAIPLGYSKQADTDFMREILDRSRSIDQTDIWLPPNNGAVVDTFNVELESATKVKRKILVPTGSGDGLGFLPGTNEAPRGWQYDTDDNPKTRGVGIPWIAYRPGSQQAGVVAWSGVLANTRRQYFVSTERLTAAWDEYWLNLIGRAYPPGDPTGLAYRLQWVLNPYARDASGKLIPYEELAKIPREYWDTVDGDRLRRSQKAEGLTRMGPFVDEKSGQILTRRGLTRYIIATKLRARQLANLGTLTCAYVSEDDTAFRGDAELAGLLETRRRQLLTNRAANDVDLTQVVDADYKQALWSARLKITADPGPPKAKPVIKRAIPNLPPAGVPLPNPTGTKPFFPAGGGGAAELLGIAIAARVLLGF